MSCLECFRGRKQLTKSFDSTTGPMGRTCARTESMVSAVDGERNSITSFVSFDVDGQEDMFANIEAHGRNTSRLFKSIVSDKAGFRVNGKVGEVSLWFSPKTVGALPLISLGETEVNGSIALDSIIDRVMDLSRKSEWDPEFLTAKEISLRQIDDDCRIRTCWSACKSKPGIAGRDFVYHAFSCRGAEEWLVASWSADIDEVPPEYAPKEPSAVHVRAKLVLGGFYVRRSVSGQWLVSYINQVELGLSSWLTDPVLKKSPAALLNNLKSVLERDCIV